MRKLGLLLMLFLISTLGWAQISGIKTIPGDYATVSAAVDALNLQGVGTGGVTFNVAASHTEVVPVGGILLTATGTATNPIVFQKNGVGANPILSRTDAGSIATSSLGGHGDAVLIIEGSDFVTFDAIDISTTDQGIEYGYYIRKVSATDGVKNTTIKNANITMTRGTSQYVVGIYSSNNVPSSSISSAVGVTVTSEDGRNENLTFIGNTITNVFTGIIVRGFNHTTAPRNFFDQNVVIGQLGAGNVITDFAGNASATAYGIYTIYVNDLFVSYNSIDNQPGPGAGFTAIGYGIFTSTATSVNTTITNNIVTVKSNGTTQGLHGINNSSGGTAANNTITIANNIVENCNYETATTGIFNGIINSGSAAFINIYGNLVTNNVLSGTGSMTLIDGGGAAASVVDMYNNVVSGNQKTGASGSMFSARAAGATTFYNNNIFNNGFTNSSGTTSANVYGYYNFGSPLFEEIYNNNIYNLYVQGANTATASTISGILTNTTANASKLIYGNSIYGLAALSGSVSGISQSLGVNARIFNNNIYDLSNNDATTTVGRVNGILIASGIVYAYNNFISDLKAPLGNNNDVVRGISITSTTANSEVGLYHNTIFLNAQSTGTNFGTSGIFHTSSATATTATLDMRNNIVVNKSIPFGTGLTVAYRRSSAVLDNYSTISNNNNFYAGTPSATNLIFFNNTDGDETLAAFKLRVVPAENGSFSENSPFINSTVAPYNLRINTSISTQLESAGAIITTPFVINTDFDNNPRFGNPLYVGTGSAPDVGANEGNFTGLDLTPPAISYTLFDDYIVSTSKFEENIEISDASGVNFTTFKPRLYYKKLNDNNVLNGNTSADNGWKWVETASTSSPVSFTIDHTILFGGSVSVGDTIQYFVVAQDLSSAGPFVGINSGQFASIPSTVNLLPANFPVSGTINSYAILPSISGPLTVGTGGLYPNLTGVGGAFEALNSNVVAGNVELVILSDIIEPGTLALNQWSEAGVGNYTVTIKPADATMKIISGAPTATNGLIRLNGADRVTIDGSFAGSGRYLTFSNDAATTANVAVIQLISFGTNAGATDNTIKNSIIIGSSNATATAFGIHVGGTSISATGVGANNNNLTIQNNVFERAYYGIYVSGTTTGMNDVVIVKNNIIGSSTAGNEIGNRGIRIANSQNVLVESNTVFGFRNNSATIQTTGIEFSANVINSKISRNLIYDLFYTGTSFRAAQGINVSTVVDAEIEISNNVIHSLKGHGSATPLNNSWGIMLMTGSKINVYHNSISISETFGNAATNIHGGLYLALAVNEVNILNNIVSSAGAFGVFYNVYSLAPSTAFTSLNNNVYYRSLPEPASTTYHIGFIGGSARTTINDWKTASTYDVLSFEANPMFTSNTDLTINSGTTPTALESGAAVIAGLNIDFNGVARPAPAPVNGGGTAPDIGAYEFDGVPAVALNYVSSTTTQAVTGLVTANTSNVQIIGVEVVVAGQLGTLTANQFNFSTNGTTSLADLTNAKLWYTGTNPSFGTSTQVGATITDFTGGLFSVTANTNLQAGTNYFWLTYDIPLTAVTDNFLDAECLSIVLSSGTVTPSVTAPVGNRKILGTFSGVKTVGVSGDFSTLYDAFTAINNVGLNGNLTLNIISDITETQIPVLNQWTNVPASTNHSILIQPQGGAWTVSGNLTTIIRLNAIKNVSINGLNTGGNALTIQNNSTATNTAAIWVSSAGANQGASDISIKNTKIVGGSRTVVSSFGIYIAGTSISTTGTGADNRLILIENNIVERAYIGVYARGVLTTGRLDSVMIANNIIGSAVDSISIGNIGISLQNAINIDVSMNTIFNLSLGNNPIGMFLGADFTNAMVSANKIHSIIYSGTSGYGGKGIRIETLNSNSNIWVVNNAIYNIGGDSWSSLSGDANVGIQVLGATGGISFYYNSVKLFGNWDRSTATLSSAIYFSATATNIDLRNNVFSNSITNNTNTGSFAYAIAIEAATTTFTNINYNNYFANGVQAMLGRNTTLNVSDLVAWQALTLSDVNSISANPLFTSTSDLMPLPGSPLFNAGLPLAGFNTDINGNLRGTLKTSIGAYEAVSATINPNSFVFDIALPTNAVTNVVWNDATAITSIMNTSNSTTLLASNYSVVGNVLTINSSYLATVLTATGDSVVLSIAFNAGNNVTFTVNAINTISAVLSPDTATYIVNEPADAVTNITWNSASSVVSIIDNSTTPYTLTTSDYTIVGNVLTINQSYLATKLPTAGMSVILTVNFNVGNSATFTVNSTTTVGVENHSIEFNCYPNPSNGQFNIQVSETLNMRVFDVKGKLVSSRVIETGNTEINLTHLPSGIYVVSLSNQFKTESFRIVIE